MSKNKASNNSNEINEIVVSNPVEGVFSLKKLECDKLESKKKYKEIFISDFSLITGNVSQMALQVANQEMTLAEIIKLAPNGLFTATTDPVNLSKFANGTTTTMLRDTSGGLVEHAGFAEIGLNASVNPAIILSAGMQAMSAISGTYYLHKIHTQIKDMDAKLEELLNIHHDSNIGRLVAARKGLSETANREFVDASDISAIRNYKITADEIYEEYNYRLKRQESELNLKIDKKVEEKKYEEIYFSMSIAFEANKLSLYAELIEIGTRLKMGGQIEIITGLTRQLEQNYTDSFYRNNEKEAEKTYSLIQQRSNEKLIGQENKFEKSIDELFDIRRLVALGVPIGVGLNVFNASKAKIDINKIKVKAELENQRFETIKNDMKQNKESSGIDNIIEKVVEIGYKEKEILYIPIGNNKQRVFVSHEEE